LTDHQILAVTAKIRILLNTFYIEINVYLDLYYYELFLGHDHLIVLLFVTKRTGWKFKSYVNNTGVLFQIQWYPVLSGLVIQFLLGLITIRWSIGRNIFQCIGEKVAIFLGYSNEGAKFVYGRDLIDKGVFAFQVSIFLFTI